MNASPPFPKVPGAGLLSRIRRVPSGKRGLPASPLELACSAVLGLPTEELHAGLLHFEALELTGQPQEGIPAVSIVQTFLGSLVRLREDLRGDLEPPLRSLIGTGFLHEKARTRILRAVENLVRVRQVWRDILLFTDTDHFVPDTRFRVRQISREKAPRDYPSREHFRAGAWQGAAAILRGGTLAAYADYMERSPHVSSIGVFTDPDFRGQGFGTAVVSAATRAILRSGRVPIYCTDIGNASSLALARWLGYVKFGEDIHFFS